MVRFQHLIRVMRALNASAEAQQTITVFGHLPDLPLSDDDSAHPDTTRLFEGAYPGATTARVPAPQPIVLRPAEKGAA
jgi:hypothetical protein